MKLYAFTTPSHKVLAKEWFLASILDPYEITLETFEIPGQGFYKELSWMNAVKEKVSLILRALRENPGEIVLFSDVDIQFFSRTEPEILRLMESCDLAVLRDSPFGILGTGFMACRSNSRTLHLWSQVLAGMRRFPSDHDQEALNRLWLKESSRMQLFLWKALSFFAHLFPGSQKNPLTPLLFHIKKFLGSRTGVRLGFFPVTFWSPGITSAKTWTPGEILKPPANLVLHHANWTSGVENKIIQLRSVQKALEGSRRKNPTENAARLQETVS